MRAPSTGRGVDLPTSMHEACQPGGLCRSTAYAKYASLRLRPVCSMHRHHVPFAYDSGIGSLACDIAIEIGGVERLAVEEIERRERNFARVADRPPIELGPE